LEPDECDFIVIGSDGIFDKLSNEEVAECVWMSVKDSEISIGTPE
jgi:serine/threonine protein phosphatase PrpC